MKIQPSRLCVQASVWVLASAFCVTTLTGCGANSNFTQGLGSDVATQGLSGAVHGGPNPIIGATVTLYATATAASPSSSNAYGYGQPGTVLGTTTTDSNGNFAFIGDAKNCPIGQQAYIVAAGGNTGANAGTPNPAALLMAALGPCNGISDSTPVIINEPTTIAAAYAIGKFMSIDTSGATPVVDISAPANNNAVTGSCTVNGSNQTTACAAAGLAHAFLNAANLVNSEVGTANTAIAGSVGVVPQALINTLANSVEACINSTGDIVTPTAPCAILMTNTTPTQLASPTPPTNTLQALMDLAAYPSEATGCSSPPCAPGTGSGTPVGTTANLITPSAATTALYNVATSNGYYTPALTAIPDDFTMAIAYPETGGNLWGSAAGINDNIYVYQNTTPVTLFSVSSNGVSNWSTPISTLAGCSSFSIRCAVTHDALGNLWVADKSGLTEVSKTGVLGTTFTSINGLETAGIDLGNNVWLGVSSIASAGTTAQPTPSGLEELPVGATQIIDVNVGGVPVPYTTKQPIFDSYGNLWVESDNTGGSGGPGMILMLNDTGSLTSPAFTNAGSGSGNPVNFPGGDATPGQGVSIDPSGNVWFSAQDDMLSIPSGGGEAGGLNYGSLTIEYGPVYEAGVDRNATMDGDGNIVIDATSTGAGYLSIYYPTAPADGQFVVSSTTGDTGALTYMNPCYIASGTTVCLGSPDGNGGSALSNNPRSTTIDDTGAIWAPSQSSGFLIQVLGPAAPTWGQRSWIPMALAPNLTGLSTSLRPF